MLKEYMPNPMYHNYVLTSPLLSFNFISHYTELMNQSIPVFPHRHDLYEIFYGVEGSFQFECEGKIQVVEPQDFIFLGKNYLHRIAYTPGTPATYFTIIFDVEAKNGPIPAEAEEEFKEIQAALARVNQAGFLVGHCRQSQTPLLKQIHQEPLEPKLGWLCQTSTFYCQFFLNLLREAVPTPSKIKSPLGYKNIALTATKYIHANYTEDLNIDMVAKALNVTPRHINRLFQDLFGCSFARTVSIIRMEYAKRYLLNGNESIERIAARVGLPSGKVLTKLFHEQEGISPAKYRALHQKKPL